MKNQPPLPEEIFVRPIRHIEGNSYWVDIGSRTSAVRSSSDFQFLRNAITQSYEGIACPPLPSTCSDAVSSAACEVVEEFDTVKHAKEYFIARYFETFLRRVCERLYARNIRFNLLEKFLNCSEADWRIVKNDYGEVEPTSASPGWLSNILNSPEEDEQNEIQRQRQRAVRDVLKAQRDVLRAQKRLAHSLKILGSSIATLGTYSGENVTARFGYCLEMSRRDLHILNYTHTSFSLVENLGERDSLVVLENLVNARIAHFTSSYKQVNDELYRANAALCAIRRADYHNHERRESENGDAATLTRRVDELSSRAMTRRNSAETIRTLLVKSMQDLRKESSLNTLRALLDWARVQARTCMTRRTNLERFYMSIYNDDIVKTHSLERLDFCLVEARNIEIPDGGGLLCISFAIKGYNEMKRFRSIRMDNGTYIFGQIVSFDEIDETSDTLRIVASDDRGRYIGSTLISLLDLNLEKGLDTWWSLDTAQNGGEIRIRVTSKVAVTKDVAVDQMGFRVPKRYIGMTHYCFLESCMMSRHIKRWCLFGSGSLNGAMSRVSQCISPSVSMPPKGLPWTLGQEIRDLLWGGLPSSIRHRSWFLFSGANRIASESKKTYELYLQDQVEDSVRNAVEADCVRTFASHCTKLDKNALRRVLLAHASRSPHIGYAQGLSHIAGFVMSTSGFSERDTFWILSAITERLCQDYYTPSMFGLRRDFYVLRELVHHQHPDVLRHLDKLGAPLAVFVTGSFLSHFVLHLPSHTLLRVMDITMWLGSAGLIVGVLALIGLHRQHLLRARSLAQVKEVWQEVERRCYDTEVLMRAMQNTWFDIDNGAGPINRLVFLRNRHESRIVSRENTEEGDDDDD